MHVVNKHVVIYCLLLVKVIFDGSPKCNVM